MEGKKKKGSPSQLPLAPDDCLLPSPDGSLQGHWPLWERGPASHEGLGTDTRGRYGSNVHVTESKQQAGEDLAVMSAKPSQGSIPSGHNVEKGTASLRGTCRLWGEPLGDPQTGDSTGDSSALKDLPQSRESSRGNAIQHFYPLLHA